MRRFVRSAAAVGNGGAGARSESLIRRRRGIDENVAGLLCYTLFHWFPSLIFLLLDKRPFVIFHAAQAIAFTLFAAGLGSRLAMFGFGF